MGVAADSTDGGSSAAPPGPPEPPPLPPPKPAPQPGKPPKVKRVDGSTAQVSAARMAAINAATRLERIDQALRDGKIMSLGITAAREAGLGALVNELVAKQARLEAEYRDRGAVSGGYPGVVYPEGWDPYADRVKVSRERASRALDSVSSTLFHDVEGVAEVRKGAGSDDLVKHALIWAFLAPYERLKYGGLFGEVQRRQLFGSWEEAQRLLKDMWPREIEVAEPREAELGLALWLAFVVVNGGDRPAVTGANDAANFLRQTMLRRGAILAPSGI